MAFHIKEVFYQVRLLQRWIEWLLKAKQLNFIPSKNQNNQNCWARCNCNSNIKTMEKLCSCRCMGAAVIGMSGCWTSRKDPYVSKRKKKHQTKQKIGFQNSTWMILREWEINPVLLASLAKDFIRFRLEITRVGTWWLNPLDFLETTQSQILSRNVLLPHDALHHPVTALTRDWPCTLNIITLAAWGVLLQLTNTTISSLGLHNPRVCRS